MRLFGPKRPGGGRIGLGDAVEVIAVPVVKVIKATTKVDLGNCVGCKKRKAKLNKWSDKVIDFIEGKDKTNESDKAS